MKIQRSKISILLLFLTHIAYGQELCEVCGEPYELPKPVIVHDTIYISKLDDITREFGMSFDDYVRAFLKFKDEKDSLNQFPMEKIYLNYFLPLFNPGQDIFKSRMITREMIITPTASVTKLRPIRHPQADSLENTNLATDCLLTIYGEENTNRFLESPTKIKSCLGQLFTHVYNSKGKINGVNFYFPDYTFKEKRAMAQFIKSASIVIDSCKMQSIRNLRLYVSFNEDQIKNDSFFLYGLSQMTDSIFAFNYATGNNTLPEISVIDKSKAQSLNLFSKLQNQLYLARYYTKQFPEKTTEEFSISAIYDLIDADYPNNQWEYYLYAITAIILVIVIAIVLYIVSPVASFYANRSMDYIYALIVMVFLEILILIANMFEAMSKDDVFSLSNDNHYIVLLLPLLFIFIVPMMKALGRKRLLP